MFDCWGSLSWTVYMVKWSKWIEKLELTCLERKHWEKFHLYVKWVAHNTINISIERERKRERLTAMIVVTIVKVNTKFTDMVNSLCIPHLVLVHSLSLIRLKKEGSACDYFSFCSFSLCLHENLKVLRFPGFHYMGDRFF